ncbi:hypothetical protein BGY98DRAFT_1094012 [Russula aff. rugulosa BPL654]|nr:hypothetical protein BGY98DRAFT_1094012 [Russula aff. rugulosa BPL654]
MTNRMYHSVPVIDQHSWPDVQDFSFILPSSPAPSSCSSVTPQMQLDFYDPTSTSFYQNSFKELGDFYAPSCTSVSTPPGREDVLNALSQLYSANPRPPGRPTKQTPPGQQIVFGDTQSHCPFDIDNFCLSPTAYKNYNPAPIAPIPASFPQQSSQLDGRNFLTCPIPLEPVSKPDDPSRQEGSLATAPPLKRQPTLRASGLSSKTRKRKAGKAVNVDEIVLLQCCMTVKPESLARHLKSDGHKRSAGLPLDRPEVCSLCNIAFARQDARNRHFRSQHGGVPSPATGAVYKRLKKPSATHPSLLPNRRK